MDRPIDGSKVIDVDRGGRITWHGPGQLVGYPIIALRERFNVVGFVRSLESAIIDSCAEFGLDAIRIKGKSGVWVDAEPARKVAAIGIRVASGVLVRPDRSVWNSRCQSDHAFCGNKKANNHL